MKSAGKRLESDVELVRERARAVDTGKSAVIATDPSGNVIYWSEGAAELYGWAHDEAKGRNIVELTPALRLRPEASHIMRQLRSGEAWSGAFDLRTRSGSRFNATVSLTPVYTGHGKLVGIVGVTTPAKPRPQTGKKAAE